MTIRRKLTVGVLTVFLVSFLLVSAVTLSIARHSLIQGVVDQMLVVADGYATDLDTQLQTFERVVRDLSRDILVATDEQSALAAKGDLYTNVNRFYFTGPDGSVQAQYPQSRVLAAFDYSVEPFWRELRETMEPSVSPLRRVYGYASFTFSAPVFADAETDREGIDPEAEDSSEEVLGFVHAAVSTDSMFESIREVVVGDSGYLFVVDERGRFLSHPTESELRSLSDLADDPDLAALEDNVRETGSGAGFYEGADGRRIVAFAPLGRAGWSLGVNASSAYFTANVDRAMLLLGIALALAAFLVSGFTYAVVGRMLSPVNALVDSISQVREGKFGEKVHLHGSDEITVLADAYNRMTDRLERSFQTIQEYSRTLENQVAERTEQLREANDALRADQQDMERQLAMARRVQQNLLPQRDDYPETDALSFATEYSSMDDIGGDFYDILEISPGVYGFLIADVSGHGMPAALITAMVKVSFHTNVEPGISTDEMLSKVNEEMLEFIGDLEYFVSAFFAIYDTRTRMLRYTNAGHHPALLIRSGSGEFEKLDSDGLFIGCFEDVPYSEESVEVVPGDRLVMFTDGIIEARDFTGEQYEYERFYETMRANLACSPQDFATRILDDVDRFIGHEDVGDDQAVFCVDFERGGPSEAGASKGEKRTEAVHSAATEWLKQNYRAAVHYYNERDYEEAIRLLTEIRRHFPENAKVTHTLGLAYFHSGQLEQALEFLRQAHERNRDNERYRKNLDFVSRRAALARTQTEEKHES